MPLTDRIKTTIENIKNMPLNRKLALAGLVVIVFAMLLTLLLWLPKQDYQILYTNLTAEDAGNVINKLKEKKVPYQVKDNAIYVPSDKVHELRLELAAQGIPSGGGVGFEIFDKTQIGLTEFSQRVNYIRALQGELQRTIKQLQEVDQVRVHIAIPEKNNFYRKGRPSNSLCCAQTQARQKSLKRTGLKHNPSCIKQCRRSFSSVCNCR